MKKNNQRNFNQETGMAGDRTGAPSITFPTPQRRQNFLRKNLLCRIYSDVALLLKEAHITRLEAANQLFSPSHFFLFITAHWSEPNSIKSDPPAMCHCHRNQILVLLSRNGRSPNETLRKHINNYMSLRVHLVNSLLSWKRVCPPKKTVICYTAIF